MAPTNIDVSATDMHAANIPELVELLKTKPGFEFPDGYDLNELINEIETALAATIGTYASKNIKLRVSQVSKLNASTQLVYHDANGSIFPTVSTIICNDEGALRSAIHITTAKFHQFISTVLGRGEFVNSNVLSAAQIRLFRQFSHQIAINLETIQGHQQKISSPTICDIERISTEMETRPLVIISFELIMDEQTYVFYTILPQQFFDSTRNETDTSSGNGVQSSFEEIWQAKLRSQIAQLKIPLKMHFSTSEMALEKIQNLSIGDKLGDPVDLEDIRVCDLNGDCEFIAGVKLTPENIQLTPQSRKSK